MVRRLALAIVLLPAALYAAPQGQPSPDTLPPGGLNPAQVARLLDAYVLVQAQESLQLSDAQYGQFVSRMKTLQEVRRRNQQARHRILQDLGRLAGQASQPAAPDEGALRERLKALADHDERAAAELRQAYEALDGVLDLRQRARFRVFEERMERQKLELLMKARQANRPQRQNHRRVPQ
jgi:hypothetical protein